jgi:hypothetical protein
LLLIFLGRDARIQKRFSQFFFRPKEKRPVLGFGNKWGEMSLNSFPQLVSQDHTWNEEIHNVEAREGNQSRRDPGFGKQN